MNPWLMRDKNGNVLNYSMSDFERATREHGINTMAAAIGVSRGTVVRVLARKSMFSKKFVQAVHASKPFGLTGLDVWHHYKLEPPNPEDPCNFLQGEHHRRRTQHE